MSTVGGDYILDTKITYQGFLVGIIHQKRELCTKQKKKQHFLKPTYGPVSIIV